MDNNFESPETSDSTDFSFGQEVAKSFVISALVSAGVVTGFVAVSLTMSKIDEIKKKRAAKKAAKQDNTEN